MSVDHDAKGMNRCVPDSVEIILHPHFGSRRWHREMYQILAECAAQWSIPRPLAIIMAGYNEQWVVEWRYPEGGDALQYISLDCFMSTPHCQAGKNGKPPPCNTQGSKTPDERLTIFGRFRSPNCTRHVVTTYDLQNDAWVTQPAWSQPISDTKNVEVQRRVLTHDPSCPQRYLMSVYDYGFWTSYIQDERYTNEVTEHFHPGGETNKLCALWSTDGTTIYLCGGSCIYRGLLTWKDERGAPSSIKDGAQVALYGSLVQLFFTSVNHQHRLWPTPRQMTWSKQHPNCIMYATTEFGIARYDLLDGTVEIVAHNQLSGNWTHALGSHSIVCTKDDHVIWNYHGIPDAQLQFCPFGLYIFDPATRRTRPLLDPLTTQSESSPVTTALDAFVVCESESCIYALSSRHPRILRLVYRIPDTPWEQSFIS